jgi:hypothetical protein
MEGFKVGDKVDCDISELPTFKTFKQDVLYPGTIIAEELKGVFYYVDLSCIGRPQVLLAKRRLTPERTDVCETLPNIGDQIHVQYFEPDNPIPFWRKATVKHVFGKNIASCFLDGTFVYKWLGDFIRPAVAPLPKEEVFTPSCKECEKHPRFGQHKTCGACFVYDKVDRIMDALDERAQECEHLPARYRWNQRQLLLTRALIAQQGGQSSRRDKRLQKKLIHLTAWFDDVLPKYVDEQEWKP